MVGESPDVGTEDDESTRLRAMLKVDRQNLPGSPTPLSGMRDALLILLAGVSVGAVVARAISPTLSPVATAAVVFGSLVVVASPLFWIRIAKPIVRAVEAERRRVIKRDAENATITRRQEFDARLARALDMADSEESVLEIVRRALARLFPNSRTELLLADSSNAHLERVVGREPDRRARRLLGRFPAPLSGRRPRPDDRLRQRRGARLVSTVGRACVWLVLRRVRSRHSDGTLDRSAARSRRTE